MLAYFQQTALSIAFTVKVVVILGWQAFLAAAVDLFCPEFFVHFILVVSVLPGRLAIGAGDSVLRVWHTGSKVSPYDVTTFWHGINSKVTSVSRYCTASTAK